MPIESDCTALERTSNLADYAQAPLARSIVRVDQRERPYAGRAGYPLITIGVPTRNRSALLKKCLESIFAQTYQNIEVLVSDNASTDDTLAVLQSVGDSRLRILSNPEDIGASENFANCVREARGDYLVLVSDDNTLDPLFLEKCARLIRQAPGLPIVLAAFDIAVLNEFHRHQRRIVPGSLSRTLSTGIWGGTGLLKECFTGRLTAAPLSVVVRTDLMRESHLFSSGYQCAADTGWFQALLEGQAGLINERCAVYLVHDSAISAGISPDIRVREYCNSMREFSSALERKISDSATRKQVRGLIAKYLVLQIMITLVLYRRAGASLTDVVGKLRTWRPILRQCPWWDALSILRIRSVARILLPPAAARWSIALGLDKLV
jgi:glycosyltransferase involved in cell wall biosynthesis